MIVYGKYGSLDGTGVSAFLQKGYGLNSQQVTHDYEGEFAKNQVAVKINDNTEEIATYLLLKKQYTVTVVNGTVNGDSFAAGDTVTIEADNLDGQDFTGWTVTDGAVSLADPSATKTTFTMPARNVTVTANYTSNAPAVDDGHESSDDNDKKPTYTVTVKNGTVNGKTSNSFAVGETVIIVADIPANHFNGWTVTDDAVSLADPSETTTTFTMPERDVTVTANYQPNAPVVDDGDEDDEEPIYRVTVEETDGGEVTSNRKWAYGGTTVTLTVTSENGYDLADLTVTDRRGNEMKLTDKGEGVYTFRMPYSNVTVTAVFDSEYAIPAMQWACGAEVIYGTTDTTLSPEVEATRAQIAVIFHRYCVDVLGTQD